MNSFYSLSNLMHYWLFSRREVPTAASLNEGTFPSSQKLMGLWLCSTTSWSGLLPGEVWLPQVHLKFEVISPAGTWKACMFTQDDGSCLEFARCSCHWTMRFMFLTQSLHVFHYKVECRDLKNFILKSETVCATNPYLQTQCIKQTKSKAALLKARGTRTATTLPTP